MFFKKLETPFLHKSFLLKDKTSSFGVNGKGISYYKLDENNSHLFDFIKEPYRKYFNMRLMSINYKHIPPHTDSNITVAINFYLETNGYKTTFFKFKDEHYEERKIPGQTTGSAFKYENLIEIDSFIANPGEVWVLDVTKPHSVRDILNNNLTRTAITLNSNFFSFNETLEILSFN